MDKTLDGGPISAQSQMEVKTNNIRDLQNQIHQIEHEMYPLVIKQIAEGKLEFKEGEVIRT